MDNVRYPGNSTTYLGNHAPADDRGAYGALSPALVLLEQFHRNNHICLLFKIQDRIKGERYFLKRPSREKLDVIKQHIAL